MSVTISQRHSLRLRWGQWLLQAVQSLKLSHYLALINRAGGLYGRILTEVASTDRTQWGLYQRPRSRFSHTDRPSSVNKMFIIYGQTRKQRNRNINNFICFPARAQAFNWLSSVTGLQSKRDKNSCSKSSFVQTSSMNEEKIFHTGSMKTFVVETIIYEKWPKVQQQCK